MRCAAVRCTGAGAFSWQPDTDIVLQWAEQTLAINALVTWDRTLTTAGFTAPGSQGVLTDVLIWLNGTASNSQLPPQLFQIPVALGSTLFVVVSAAGTVFLYYNLPSDVS